MADTIEAFVAKLQAEGVQAGRAAAEELIAKARRDSDEIIRQAEARAAKITSDAEAQAQATLAKAQTELQLAARDTVLRLRDAIGRAIRAVLAAGTSEKLSDPQFLSRLLSDIVLQYVQADIAGKVAFKINVSHQVQEQLAAWALERMHRGDVSLDLKGTLAEAGFEYQVGGANVEVTLTSVVDALADLVSPALREVIEQAVADSARGTG
jgi:vacuolar-type H+-ATPase subunit H